MKPDEYIQCPACAGGGMIRPRKGPTVPCPPCKGTGWLKLEEVIASGKGPV